MRATIPVWRVLLNRVLTSYVYSWKNSLNFRGRASRFEFWNFLIITALSVIYLSLFVLMLEISGQIFQNLAIVLISILSISTLAVSYRRMHDTNNPGWYIFASITIFTVALLPGDEAENQYGPVPEI